MGKASRIILGLRAAGWANDEILDFILWIAAGEEQYRPHRLKAAAFQMKGEKQMADGSEIMEMT